MERTAIGLRCSFTGFKDYFIVEELDLRDGKRYRCGSLRLSCHPALIGSFVLLLTLRSTYTVDSHLSLNSSSTLVMQFHRIQVPLDFQLGRVGRLFTRCPFGV